MDTDYGQKVFELISHNPTCVLTAGSHGSAVESRPITIVKTEGSGELRSVSSSRDYSAQSIGTGDEGTLSFCGASEWRSLHGSTCAIKGERKARELWNPAITVFF